MQIRTSEPLIRPCVCLQVVRLTKKPDIFRRSESDGSSVVQRVILYSLDSDLTYAAQHAIIDNHAAHYAC